MNTETTILPRSGERPLEIAGELAAVSYGQTDQGACNTRWWDIYVYRLASGRYVLALQWRTNWQGEMEHDEAIVHDDLEGVAHILESIDPLERMEGRMGYPDSPKYHARQQRLESDIRSRWDCQVSAVLRELGITEKAD